MVTTEDQYPGCVIPDRCMLYPDQSLTRRDAFCESDLKCICKVDNHLGTNSLFSSECLLKECTDEHERKSFLKDWLESCRQAGKSGWDDMPWEWEPYLPHGEIVVRPTTFLNAPPATSSSTVQSSVSVVTSTAAVATSLPVTSWSMTTLSILVTSTSGILSTFANITSTSFSIPEATTTPAQPITITSRPLSPDAIGGIVTGILLLVILCAGLGFFYWKANKKANEKNREVAILSDRVSGCGFQKRIDELLAESNSSTGTILRHNAPTPDVLEMAGGSTSTVGVTSQSSSVYSMDLARAL
ncbi:hypothetical protein BU25DRAFT_492614 [Macroventuria anomochaeta]|uniref:Uncharacterized protein n=1 Tax=Macroventuria anomochaeta TaxID=301207 RepID=A0ACB6RUK2_9PLEO|nr:uncharacterized protein BU25DRAFT_492614 [Macroventuria anomochaeta]KAF2625685.1 hypothetical protein BU25DRAFT_492614 [Macroventuria anomochaeta]